MEGPLLDHVVINVRYGMDLAERRFSAIGFELTPRGFHTLGSINHLMVLETDYLELIGLPGGGEVTRPEIAAAPVGLDGLVFKSSDVEATYAQLTALDLAGDPPRAFSRPVHVDGTQRSASFRTVAVRNGVFDGGRVYFCQHLTPDLVWRRAWQGHPNGALSTREFVLLAADPAREAARYARLLGPAAEASAPGDWVVDLTGSRLRFLDAAAAVARFGRLAPELAGAHALFAAVCLRCRDLNAARGLIAAASGVCTSQDLDDRIVARVNDYHVLLEFTGP